jgi:hypothetical protein
MQGRAEQAGRAGRNRQEGWQGISEQAFMSVQSRQAGIVGQRRKEVWSE